MKYPDKVKLLREKVSIGIGNAEKLLAENDGNVIMAEQSFKENMVELFIKEHLLSDEQATKYLEAARYDLEIANQLFEKDNCSVTTLCLKKYKDKEEALLKILLSIEQKYNYDFWLCWQKDDVPLLNKTMETFVMLIEWIFYVNSEGELIINSGIAVQWEKLQVKWLDSLFERALKRAEELKGTDKNLWEEPVYKSFHDTFRKREKELIDRLYEFVNEHTDEFP